MNAKTCFVLIAALAVLGILAVQQHSMRRLSAEVAALRQDLNATATTPDAGDAPARERLPAASNAALQHRVAELEAAVTQLMRTSEHLMERGQVPLTSNKVEALFGVFADATAADRDRLRALRQLRRNRVLTEDAVPHALKWLETATNASLREDILDQLSGLTNSALRGPLLALATTDATADVRREAMHNLRRFVNDPEVEAQLMRSYTSDPDPGVRRAAEEALIEGPMSATRLASLRERAANPNGTLDERMLAWRALREAGQDAPQASASLAQLAQNVQDPLELARLFQNWDSAIDRPTDNDAAFLPPLVQGLQNPNALVRERAADALRDFRSDPTVQQWLRHVAENDPDAAVRRQALRGLGQGR